MEYSRSNSIPLHPKYTYFWADISVDEISELRNQLIKDSNQYAIKGNFDSNVLAELIPVLKDTYSKLDFELIVDPNNQSNIKNIKISGLNINLKATIGGKKFNKIRTIMILSFLKFLAFKNL